METARRRVRMTPQHKDKIEELIAGCGRISGVGAEFVNIRGGAMLQTIEVEIDAKGHIHPLERIPVPHKGKSRALLTILPAVRRRSSTTIQENPAFGVLTASRSVGLDEMETAIHSRGSRL